MKKIYMREKRDVKLDQLLFRIVEALDISKITAYLGVLLYICIV